MNLKNWKDYRFDLYFAKRHQSKIKFLKEKREELLNEVKYIYETISLLSEEIKKLENEN